MENALPEIKPRQIVLGTLGIVFVGLGFWLLYRFHQVVIIFFAAVIISSAIKPIVKFLFERGWPRRLGVIVVFALLLLLIIGLVWLLTPLTIKQSTALIQKIPESYVDLREAMLRTPNFFVWRLGYELPENLPVNTLRSISGDGGPAGFANQELRFISLLGRGIFAVVATLVLAFYWTLDGQRIIKSLTLYLPAGRREDVRRFLTEAQSKIEAFVVGQAILCFAIGLLALGVFLLFGLPNAFLLALVAGLLEAIPLIGPILGAIPAALVAFSISPTKALLVVLAMAIVQQLENQYLVPRVMRRSLGINPLVTLLALMGFGLLFGVPGALVAIPLTAVIQLLLDRTFLAASPPDQQSVPDRDRRSLLLYEVQEFVADLRQHIRHKVSNPTSDNDYIEDSMETIAAELEHILSNQDPEGERA